MMILKEFKSFKKFHSKNLSVEKRRKDTVFLLFSVCKSFQYISFFAQALMATFSTILVSPQKSAFFIGKRSEGRYIRTF